MKAIGLMSGTSLDGLDMAYCEIHGCYTETKVSLLKFGEAKMPDSLKGKILKACTKDLSSTPLVCSLNFEVGSWMGKAVRHFMDENGLKAEDVDFISSHGQTIWHQPAEENGYARSTLQIGEPAEIAWQTGVKVISGFRTMDMAAGGEGAPLVPYADFILYRSHEKNRTLLNIGGISNVTFLPADCKEEDVMAFDTGPGNMMIDEAMRQLYGLEYDDSGRTAASGSVNADLLQELMNMPYIHAEPPKSTGREMFGKDATDAWLAGHRDQKNEDLIATLTAFTADSISENIRSFLNPHGHTDELLVGGGGAHNETLMRRLAQDLPGTEVVSQDEIGFSSDAKEAVAFVILGNETLHHHYANLISATGAKSRVILGSITPATQRFQDETEK